MSPAVFRWEHRVSYAECTVGNHVYYARYLDLLERARGEFFRHLGVPFGELQEQGVIFPVIEARLRYKAPARYDDVITIEVGVARAEGIRLDFRHQVVASDGKVLVEAETQHVCTTLEDRPRRLPEALAAALGPWRFAANASESTGK
jgi:acyl-CoA thioester hydrolase